MSENSLIQIVGPTDNWVLQKLASILVRKLPYASFSAWRPQRHGVLAYYVNYALFEAPSGLLDVGFFTHRDESFEFQNRASAMDACVCMARIYSDWLKQITAKPVVHIPMGFDSLRYRPSLVLGVIGQLDNPRKGVHLVNKLRELTFVEIVTTEGRLPESSLREIYQRVDLVLIPATVEGGPMSLFEGLGMGKPVIAPEGVGAVPEFKGTEHIHLYPAGDPDALVTLVTRCYERKCEASRVVSDRSWNQWAADHDRFFTMLLREHGKAIPVPGPLFRFGLIEELLAHCGNTLSPGTDLSALEIVVDRIAAHLYFDQLDRVFELLENESPQFPILRHLPAIL